MSHMLGPLPSSFQAPSIWYEAVATPHWKPSGKSREDLCLFVAAFDAAFIATEGELGLFFFEAVLGDFAGEVGFFFELTAML